MKVPESHFVGVTKKSVLLLVAINSLKVFDMFPGLYPVKYFKRSLRAPEYDNVYCFNPYMAERALSSLLCVFPPWKNKKTKQIQHRPMVETIVVLTNLHQLGMFFPRQSVLLNLVLIFSIMIS